MELAEKTALLESCLMRAAEQVGDITAPAMARYYRDYPEAKASFEELAAGSSIAMLEGQMVESALYCLMYWFDSPGEIEIMLSFTVPHHEETLHIPASLFTGLLDAVIEVIAETIPQGCEAEGFVLHEVHEALNGIIESSRLLSHAPNYAAGPAMTAHACPHLAQTGCH